MNKFSFVQVLTYCNDDIIAIPCMVKNEAFNKFLEGFYNNELKDDEED